MSTDETVKLVKVYDETRRTSLLPRVAPSILNEEEKICCNCGSADVTEVCEQCRAAWFCSEECASAAGFAIPHKKLCYKRKTTKPPAVAAPDNPAVKIFCFPAGEPKPKIVYIRASTWEADEGSIAEDVTMNDFASMRDFFAWFGWRFVDPGMMPLLALFPQPPPSAPITGVIIHCEAVSAMKEAAFGMWEKHFEAVLVDGNDPIRGLITLPVGQESELSALCGIKMRFFKFPRPFYPMGYGNWADVPGSKRNPIASTITQDNPAYAEANRDIVGDVLVVRSDDTDLTKVDVATLFEVAKDAATGAVVPSTESYNTAWARLYRQWAGLSQELSLDEASLVEEFMINQQGDAFGPMERDIPVAHQVLPALPHRWL
ncbi:hypothetical protein QBC34DRAFT_454832 [Podospora aff. communis PSN243]|uniref:MYND-type domain-containing protein n=1 Tax=Podospora aff. communis PSN243 TaxID=3040156 RepID=A0AAV9G4R1_9PEZI|nr:hypothetical protein QBC34DRAFT_454832 [Podospora aff. communis PSN243]